MGVVLRRFESKSKPGKYYEVTLPFNGGNPYCTCWQWKQNRHCQHLEAYYNKSTIPVVCPIVKDPTVEDDVGQVIALVLK